MGKKILDSKLLYALLAIIIAIGLWFYVAAVENEDGEMSITGVSIEFLNEDVLEENDLMITVGRDQRATLTVTGRRTTLARLNQEKENIRLTIDVSRITAPGEQKMAYDVDLPAGYASSVSIIDREPNNISFTVSRRISREVPVEGRFTGSLAEGYMLDGFTILPEKITVSGIESQINQISHAQVIVGGQELSATVTGDIGFTLIGYQGEELTDLQVECSTETVSVTLPVIKTAEVKLAVELIEGGGVINDDRYVSCEIEPKSIIVSGAEEDLEPLKEIILGEIELGNIIERETFEFDIPLNSALENISGITTATVTVEIRGLESKYLTTSNIETIYVPEGFEAKSVTQNVEVLVRGPSEAIDQVFAHNLRVVADLSGVSAASGRYTVPVKVYLDGTSDVGVVGSRKIAVDLFPEGQGEEATEEER